MGVLVNGTARGNCNRSARLPCWLGAVIAICSLQLPSFGRLHGHSSKGADSERNAARCGWLRLVLHDNFAANLSYSTHANRLSKDSGGHKIDEGSEPPVELDPTTQVNNRGRNRKMVKRRNSCAKGVLTYHRQLPESNFQQRSSNRSYTMHTQQEITSSTKTSRALNPFHHISLRRYSRRLLQFPSHSDQFQIAYSQHRHHIHDTEQLLERIMSKPVVLITSATSRNGSDAAKLVLAQGKHTLRLAARDPSKLSELEAQGAEVVALDPASAESMAQACAGADIVYLILPTLVGDAEAVMFRTFLRAATAPNSSVKHIVYLSAGTVGVVDPAQAKFQSIHNHYEHEQLLKQSGIPFMSLRPAWFYENQVRYHADSIRRTGEFKTSACDGVWTSMAVRDIAAAAAAVVSDPARHAGKIYTLTTEAVTDEMVAAKISAVTGQKVRHVNLTPDEHKELILQSYFSGAPAWQLEAYASALVTLDWEKRSSLFSKMHPDLEELLGRKGVSLEAFLAEHPDAFKRLPQAA